MSSPRSSSPRKGRKHPPSKKLSRGKRVLRCEACGKHDGDDVAEGEPGAKVKLKICARCRATAYCSMECQRARWERHRLRCRKPEDVPPPPKTFSAPSPGSRQGSTNNAMVVWRKVPPMTQTPRNREKAPTRHPFFPERPRDVSPPFTPLMTPVPIAGRERRQHLQAKTLQEHDEQEEDRMSCPSPPMMQRLSMPGNTSTGNRQLLKPAKVVSASRLPGPEPSQALRVASRRSSAPPSSGATAAADVDLRTHSAPNDLVRSPMKTPQMRQGRMTRRSTYSPETLARVAARALPSRRPSLRPGPALHRRESAPIHPVSLDKGRAWNRRLSAESSRDRGPPPPYSYALSRRGSPSRPMPRMPQDSSDKPAVDRTGSPHNLIPPPSVFPSRASLDFPVSLGGRPGADQQHGRARGLAQLRRSLSTVEGMQRPGMRDVGERRIKRAGSGAFWMDIRGSQAEAMVSKDADVRANADSRASRTGEDVERDGDQESPTHVTAEGSPPGADAASASPPEGKVTDRRPVPTGQAELQTVTTEKVHETHVLPVESSSARVPDEAEAVEPDDEPPVKAACDVVAEANKTPGAQGSLAEVETCRETEADQAGGGESNLQVAPKTELAQKETEDSKVEEGADGSTGGSPVPAEEDSPNVPRETGGGISDEAKRDRALSGSGAQGEEGSSGLDGEQDVANAQKAEAHELQAGAQGEAGNSELDGVQAGEDEQSAANAQETEAREVQAGPEMPPCGSDTARIEHGAPGSETPANGSSRSDCVPAEEGEQDAADAQEADNLEARMSLEASGRGFSAATVDVEHAALGSEFRVEGSSSLDSARAAEGEQDAVNSPEADSREAAQVGLETSGVGTNGGVDGGSLVLTGEEDAGVQRKARREMYETGKNDDAGVAAHEGGESRRESQESGDPVRIAITVEKTEEEQGGPIGMPMKPSPIITSLRPSRHTRDVSGGRSELVPESPLPYPLRRQAPFYGVSTPSGVNGFTRDAATPGASPPSATPDSSGSGTAGAPGRRFSPKPRPPVSPGPAALTLSLSPTSAGTLPDKPSTENAPGGPGSGRQKPAKTVTMPTLAEAMTVSTQREAEREAQREAARALARSAISPSNARHRTTPTAGVTTLPQSHTLPFVPVVEFSPERKPPTPHNPGPRRTDSATFYQRRLGRFKGSGLPPASKTYLGRPAGFSVHVLVASAPTKGDLWAKPDSPLLGELRAPPGKLGVSPRTRGSTSPIPPALRAARAERALRASNGAAGKPWFFYSSEQRRQVAEALRPGDVILLTPGRYEARGWGLQHLVSSVEIIGVGAAKACVLYNNPPPTPQFSSDSHAAAEHYLIGVMGDSSGVSIRDSLSGKDHLHDEDAEGDFFDDDSDSGWEDGALNAAEAATTFGRAVRVRLANLTLEQGSGYRGTIYQLGHESHLELDGCVVRCSQGGVNVDQGTCLVCDCTVEGSETFGVHIGGEGVVEHCTIRDCGWGANGGRKNRSSGGSGGGGDRASSGSSQMSVTGAGGGEKGEERIDEDDDDDGTDVNRFVEGMPAISVLQSSRVRVRFNVIRENAGHALQCRDALLPACQDDERAKLVRQAEVFAEEQLRSWLGDAAVLLHRHLEDNRRTGNITAEGNLCQRNRRSVQGICADSSHARSSNEGGVEASKFPAGVGVQPAGDRVSAGGENGGRRSGSIMWGSDGLVCRSTGEEDGLPLPAIMTMRYLAAMDEGYVGSMREENTRLRKRRLTEIGVA